MHTNNAWSLAKVLSAFVIAVVVQAARADDDVAGSAHESITQYAKSLESLSDKFAEHLKTRETIAGEFKQIYVQYGAAEQEAQAINLQAQTEFRAWIQAYMQVTQFESQLTEATSRLRNATGRARGAEARRVREFSRETAELRSAEQNLMERSNQIQLAQNINAQRQQKLQQELAKLGIKAQAWSNEDFQIALNYFSQSDLANVRSDLELKSAKRVLKSELEVNAANPGAQLALAVTLLRLEEFDEAQTQLDAMVNSGGMVALFAKAVRAELFLLTKQEKSAKRDLAATRALKYPETILLQARVLSMLHQFKSTESLWAALVKTSDYEVIAHCQIALSLIARTSNEAQAKRAINEAQLAIDLSGGDDWHCHLTSAACLAAAGQKDAAIAACERARELAIGNKKQICIAISEKIEQGQNVVWQY